LSFGGSGENEYPLIFQVLILFQVGNLLYFISDTSLTSYHSLILFVIGPVFVVHFCLIYLAIIAVALTYLAHIAVPNVFVT